MYSFGLNSTNLKGPVPTGCWRMSRAVTWKVTSKSPFVVTSERFRYQDLRGLTRSFSLDLPVNMSQVHWTSLAVKGLPSCQDTPRRNVNVSSVPSSFHDQSVARSGTIDVRLFCRTCWSNITRLLNTPIIGRSEMIVASSWIDMLAGLSGLYIFRMPPCFWANPASAANIARNSEPAAANPCRFRFISVYLPWLRRMALRFRPGETRGHPCHARPICWALVAGLDARKDTTYSFHYQRSLGSELTF